MQQTSRSTEQSPFGYLQQNYSPITGEMLRILRRHCVNALSLLGLKEAFPSQTNQERKVWLSQWKALQDSIEESSKLVSSSMCILHYTLSLTNFEEITQGIDTGKGSQLSLPLSQNGQNLTNESKTQELSTT